MSSIISDFERRKATAGNNTRKGSIVDIEDGTTMASGNRTPGALFYGNERVSTQPNTAHAAGISAWGEMSNNTNTNPNTNDDLTGRDSAQLQKDCLLMMGETEEVA